MSEYAADVDNSYLTRDPATWKPTQISQALHGLLNLRIINPILLEETFPDLAKKIKIAIDSHGGIAKIDDKLESTNTNHMLLSQLFEVNHVDPDSIFPSDQNS